MERGVQCEPAFSSLLSDGIRPRTRIGDGFVEARNHRDGVDITIAPDERPFGTAQTSAVARSLGCRCRRQLQADDRDDEERQEQAARQ